jgi:hypothetical protein
MLHWSPKLTAVIVVALAVAASFGFMPNGFFW